MVGVVLRRVLGVSEVYFFSCGFLWSFLFRVWFLWGSLIGLVDFSGFG